MKTLRIAVPQLKTQPVELEFENEDGGVTVKKYTLRQMTGYERDERAKRMQAAVKFNENGEPVYDAMALDTSDSFLIHLCLRDEKGHRVPEAEIKAFPDSTITELTRAVNELNKLNPEAKSEVKKD